MILIIPSSKFSRWFICPHLGIAYIAASLEKIGEKVVVIDCQYERDFKRRIREDIKYHRMVGFTVNVANIGETLEIASFIRSNYPEKKIVMGGPLATAIYEKLIPQYADIVVLGEGEETIKEIVTISDLSRIKGIAWWQDGEIRLNPKRELIQDLDSIPYPAWHLVDLSKYRPSLLRKFTIMMTSRGCPYDCINCTKIIHGYKYRERSIPNVIGEIDYLVEKFGIKEIHFWDDMFTYKPERVKRLCEAIIKKRYKRLRFAIPAGIRADINDEEMFKLMREAGFYFVIVAVESGVQKVVDGLGKRLNLEKVKDTINTLRKLNFRTGVFFMLGTPFDNLNTMQKTIDFAKQLKVHHAYFFITTPFPGTKLYELIKNKGRFLKDPTYLSCVYDEGKPVFEIDELKAEDVEKMFKRAYREFYLRPSQIARVIKGIIKDPPELVLLFKQGSRILFKGRRI